MCYTQLHMKSQGLKMRDAFSGCEPHGASPARCIPCSSSVISVARSISRFVIGRVVWLWLTQAVIGRRNTLRFNLILRCAQLTCSVLNSFACLHYSPRNWAVKRTSSSILSAHILQVATGCWASASTTRDLMSGDTASHRIVVL